ncbi:unnamed protein product [Absidia cylindrospora]
MAINPTSSSIKTTQCHYNMGNTDILDTLHLSSMTNCESEIGTVTAAALWHYSGTPRPLLELRQVKINLDGIEQSRNEQLQSLRCGKRMKTLLGKLERTTSSWHIHHSRTRSVK